MNAIRTSAKFLFFVTAFGFAALACTAGDDTSTPDEANGNSEDALSVSSCHGALPHHCQVCADGTTKCAHWVVKKRHCTIETCPADANAAAPAPAPITSASQCHGALPHFCRVCSDGTTECAHWAVKNGACVIESCPGE